VQQLKLKRVLRGDATRSYIMRPGSNSWAAVSQVCFQLALSASTNVNATSPCVLLAMPGACAPCCRWCGGYMPWLDVVLLLECAEVCMC
jgi:hypothetical protein